MSYALELPRIDWSNPNQLRQVLEEWRDRLQEALNRTQAIPWHGWSANSTATAVGATTAFSMTSTNTASGYAMPTGHELAVLHVAGYINVGTTAGFYDGALVMREFEAGGASFDTDLAIFSQATSSSFITLERSGTWDDPLAIVNGDATRRLQVGWRNATTSPGTLRANAHWVSVHGVIRRKS